MYYSENPVRQHWASTRAHVFLAGRHNKSHFTPIYVGRKLVGEVQNGVFIKQLLGSLHIYRKRPGICFDIESLKQADKYGARLVKIEDLETGTVYRAAISTIWARGFKLPDYGFGKQIGLDMHLWSKGDEPVNEQLSFWRQG